MRRIRWQIFCLWEWVASGECPPSRWQAVQPHPSYTSNPIAPGLKITAVNGDKYTAEILKDAIATAKSTTAPIELLVQNGETFSTVKVNYHGGLRYPRLQRIEGAPDRIADIVKARN